MASGAKGQNSGQTGDRKGDSARAARLRAALRENLKRRKLQVKGRAAAGTPDGADSTQAASHDSAGLVPGKRPGESQEFGHTIHIVASRIVDTTAPYDLVSKMRASFWVIAPLLARMGEAKVSLPGGCAIGTRPVDLLIMAMEKLGAKIDIEGGYVITRTRKGLHGGEITFPKVTVGGTHTALMAASLANGTSVIENAAREPEIKDVADCLNKMGAKISGAGSSRIVVEGVAKLGGARHRVLPDRIETGTYAMAVAMTGGDVLLENARAELLQAGLDVLAQTGL